MTDEPEIIPVSTVPVTTEADTGEARKPRKNGKALAKVDDASVPAETPARAGPSLLAILQAVMTDPTASIERMNQAFDFYQRVETAQARKAFDAAISAAKADFGRIVKRHEVNRGKDGGSYKHEDLADIASAIDPALAANGLSYRYRATSNPNEPVKVTCVVTHRDGHFEETTLSAGADASGGKNSIQAIGSTLSYLQRYSLRLALGVAAGREDDGNAANSNGEIITKEQCDTLIAKLDATKSDKTLFCRYFKIDGVAMLPTKRYADAIELLNKKAGQT